MNKNYSATRFSTWRSCRQKYRLAYIDEVHVQDREFDVALKGTAFHEIAETMRTGKSLEDLTKSAEEILGKFSFDKEKYLVIKSVPRFHLWWETYIAPREKEGWSVLLEHKETDTLEGKPLVGFVDILLVSPDEKKVVIVDYKSAAQAKTDPYRNQLFLYSWMVSRRLGIQIRDISLFLFFPLADLNKEDSSSVEKYMLKNMKQIVYTEDDVERTIMEFAQIIKESDAEDYENWDAIQKASISFACSFCGYCGHPDLCPLSYESGCRFPRSAKVVRKDGKADT